GGVRIYFPAAATNHRDISMRLEKRQRFLEPIPVESAVSVDKLNELDRRKGMFEGDKPLVARPRRRKPTIRIELDTLCAESLRHHDTLIDGSGVHIHNAADL